MPENTIFQKSPDFVFRNIEGEMILIPIRSKTADLNSLFSLNEVAGRVYELFDGVLSLKDIRQTLLDEYDVNEKNLTRDILELIETFSNMGVIISN